MSQRIGLPDLYNIVPITGRRGNPIRTRNGIQERGGLIPPRPGYGSSIGGNSNSSSGRGNSSDNSSNYRRYQVNFGGNGSGSSGASSSNISNFVSSGNGSNAEALSQSLFSDTNSSSGRGNSSDNSSNFRRYMANDYIHNRGAYMTDTKIPLNQNQLISENELNEAQKAARKAETEGDLISAIKAALGKNKKKHVYKSKVEDRVLSGVLNIRNNSVNPRNFYDINETNSYRMSKM